MEEIFCETSIEFINCLYDILKANHFTSALFYISSIDSKKALIDIYEEDERGWKSLSFFKIDKEFVGTIPFFRMLKASIDKDDFKIFPR